MEEIRIGSWRISYWPKPIPDRRFDYDVVHDEYDIDRNDLSFSCASIEDAREEISRIEIMLDEEGRSF